MTYVIQGNVEKVLLALPEKLAFGIMIAITIVFGIDFYYSAKAAIDLAKLLKKIQKMRLELELLATILKEETVDNLKEKSVFMLENMKERSSEVFDTLKEKMPEGFNRQEILEQLQKVQGKKLVDISNRIKSLQREKTEVLKKIGTERMSLLRKYPRAKSISFKEAFEEVKLTIEEKVKEKNKRREEK